LTGQDWTWFRRGCRGRNDRNSSLQSLSWREVSDQSLEAIGLNPELPQERLSMHFAAHEQCDIDLPSRPWVPFSATCARIIDIRNTPRPKTPPHASEMIGRVEAPISSASIHLRNLTPWGMYRVTLHSGSKRDSRFQYFVFEHALTAPQGFLLSAATCCHKAGDSSPGVRKWRMAMLKVAGSRMQDART